MIVRTGVNSWTCPHCGKRATVTEAIEAIINRCARCGFAFPTRGSSEADPAGWRSDPSEETLTDKWGSIRPDRYRILRVVASGAQGRLLLARHRHLNQLCVIKVVDTDDELWVDIANQRLQTEAQAGTRVNHPNVARVMDCDRVDHSFYLVMEYVPGQNLRRIVQDAKYLAWEQVVSVGRQTVDGLAAIHAAGLVHRDVKPSNLMLTDRGQVKLMDLGLVKVSAVSGGMGVTRAGQVLGTPLFMPPEQFEARADIDARADIYALGATMYQLLTGHAPFEGRDLDDIASKHQYDPIVWSEEESRRIPEWLRNIVQICMAKRREHRFESAAALAKALDDKAAGLQPASQWSVSTGAHGVAVMAFQNLSKQVADEWIGDAIAEYVSSRFMQYEGVHVVDRNVVATVMRQTQPVGEEAPEKRQVVEAGRLAGARHIITGSFQRQGESLRIVAYVLSGEHEETKYLATVSGPITDMFKLEEDLAQEIVEAVGPTLTRSRRREGPATGTEDLEALEKFVHGQRAFADGDYSSAISYAEEARRLDPGYAEPESLMGACHARLGDYDRAVMCHERQQRLAQEMGDTADMAAAVGNLGAMYYYKGEYAVAYEFLERAAEMSDEESETPDAAKLYGNLGMVLMRLDRPADAERAFDRAINICRKFNDLVSMVWPYNGMGTVLLKQERFTEAQEYHQRALTFAEETGDRVMVGVSQMNLGRCACLMGDFAEARIRFNAALGILERTSFWNGLTLVYEHMAEMHLLEHQPDEALASIDKRIELAQRHGNDRMEAAAWEQKARAFEQMSRTDQAVASLKKSVMVSQRPAPYESLHRYLHELAGRKPFH